MSRAPSSIDAILLDVDGTLYHQPPVRLGVMVRLALGHLSAPATGLRTASMLMAYRRMQERLRDGEAPPEGSLANAQLEMSSRHAGASVAAMEDAVRQWMHEAPQPLLPWARRRGLFEFLDEARARKIKLGVVSDYPAHTKLESMRVRHYFDVIVCAQDAEVQRFKPDPRGIVHALEQLGVAPDRAVYVGDRAEVDLVAARRAGVRGVLMRGPLAFPRPPVYLMKRSETGDPSVADYHALRKHLLSDRT